jgi:hypothetical protein
MVMSGADLLIFVRMKEIYFVYFRNIPCFRDLVLTSIIRHTSYNYSKAPSGLILATGWAPHSALQLDLYLHTFL